MKRLEQLPEITNKALGGLTAGPEMKARILAQAAGERRPRTAARRPLMAALACALVLVIGLTIGIPAMTRPSVVDGRLISAQSLGSESTGSERARLDLNGGDISISAGNGTPVYRSIWGESGKDSFPMLAVNGRTYRLLTSPDAADDRLLGGSAGKVSEFTKEPALSGSDGIISNVVSSGTQVYEISGMGGTLVAASVDGSLRVFQRVSFNNSALIGKEKLSDTLQISGRVTAMELSGVGVVTDSSVCESLVKTLLKNASFESSGSITGTQSLLIALDNGLTLQMAVKKDKLAACGVWSCPEFIEAFEKAAK